MPKNWQSLAYWDELIIGIFSAVFVLGFLHVVQDIIQVRYKPEFHFEISTHVFVEISVLIVVTLFLKKRESSGKSIKELNRSSAELNISTLELQKAIDRKTDATLLSQEITKNYFSIISHPYESRLNEYIREVQSSQGGQDLITLVEKISGLRKSLIIDQSEFWRIVSERIAFSHHRSIRSNNYILSLETYCKLLIDSLRIGQRIGNESNRALVVISFTSVTPEDWFSEREVIGNSLRDYASQMKAAISAMQSNNHVFRRFVVCKSDELKEKEERGAVKDTMMGFSLFSQIKLDWAKCSPTEKTIYLNDYHSDISLAEILSLELPDLKFYNNCNEFVFIGYKAHQPSQNENTEQSFKDISGITWEWCFCLGYTEDNVNVSASFINLKNASDSKKRIFDIPNTLSLIDQEGMIHRKRLEVAFEDFPNFVLNNSNQFASIIQFNNLIPLSEKWEIASEIWHSDEEAEMLKGFFRDVIRQEAKILDAACGTGQHSFLIQSMDDMNYELSASDHDPGNLEIFERKMALRGVNINHISADWNSLTTDLAGQRFDAITCLGTSIPYYKSWKEGGNGYEFNQEGLTNVLQQFKDSLNPDGKLLIGLSRHISKNLTETSLIFEEKDVDERIRDLIGIRSGKYKMSWQFKYDWSEKRKRIWDCHIKNQFGDDYSFRLVSHLFDISELISFCTNVFGADNVELRDISSSSYDMFVICRNVLADEPTNS